MKIAAAVFLIILGYWFLDKSNKAATIQYTTIAASDTAILQYKTPDNSTIWLKAKSKIRFASDFNRNRTIHLTGEAYFEVAHNKNYPFQVFAGNSVTTVVGTKFNISSWLANPNIEITVNDGKVIFGQDKGNTVTLVKGQRGVLTKSDSSLSIQIPEANYLSWMTKEFYFENTPLNTIMHKLADVYGFNFNISNQHLKETRLTARFSNRPLSEIIQTLEEVTGKQFIKTDNIYIIN
jgi:ferric-dicitrate binding protein FerR (iron transport regulator)